MAEEATYLKEHYRSDKYADPQAAIRARNARARELRKQGWTVTSRRWDFTDLARCIDYTLEATKG